jgi:tripartite-type tricarboxylate transporter receptor subunit TctC
MNSRQFFKSIISVGSIGAFSPLLAQLSAKPVTIVVPYPPGGPLDTAARVLAERLRGLLPTPVIVENRAGAAGTTGSAFVARAPADGHTLLMAATATHSVSPWLYPNVGYDPIKDFTPITLVTRMPNVLVMNTGVANRLGIKGVADLLSYARKNPGKLNYASGGSGTAGHLATEILKNLAKVSMVHIPYTGAAPAQLSVVAGQTDLMIDNLASASPNITAGKVLALGMTTVGRSSSFPDVPTINEVLPGFHVTTWLGILAPANLPKNTAEQLEKAFTAALKAPETAERFARMSTTPAPMPPLEFSALLKRELDSYGRVIKFAKIKLE